MAKVITIESKVKDILHSTHLAEIKATRESQRVHLNGRVSALEQVLREIAEITEEYIPGYCATCVRIQMAKLEGGEFIPAFKAVSSDVCDRCFGEPESI